MTLPLGDLGDGTSTGFHGMAGVGFQPANFPVGIQIDGMYNRLGLDDDVDGNFRILQGTANAVYRFQTSEDTKIRPYIIGGVGLYNGKVSGDDIPDEFEESETDFGINGGAGFDFVAGSLGVFVEGRFHNVFTEGNSSNFIPITVGVRLGGS